MCATSHCKRGARVQHEPEWTASQSQRQMNRSCLHYWVIDRKIFVYSGRRKIFKLSQDEDRFHNLSLWFLIADQGHFGVTERYKSINPFEFFSTLATVSSDACFADWEVSNKIGEHMITFFSPFQIISGNACRPKLITDTSHFLCRFIRLTLRSSCTGKSDRLYYTQSVSLLVHFSPLISILRVIPK